MTYSREGTGRFLVAEVTAKNDLGDVMHVNPIFFTLSSCGNDMNVDELTWGRSDRLQATNVQPGHMIHGKLVFPTDIRCDDNSLNYNSPNQSVSVKLPAIRNIP